MISYRARFQMSPGNHESKLPVQLACSGASDQPACHHDAAHSAAGVHPSHEPTRPGLPGQLAGWPPEETFCIQGARRY